MEKEGKQEKLSSILQKLEEKAQHLHDEIEQVGREDQEQMWRIYEEMGVIRRQIADIERLEVLRCEEKEEAPRFVTDTHQMIEKGEQALRKRDFPVAKKLFFRALSRDMTDPFILKNISDLYRFSGYEEKASFYLSRAVHMALQEQHIQTLYLLGYHAYELNEIEQARRCFHQVILLGPEGEDAETMISTIRNFHHYHPAPIGEEGPTSHEEGEDPSA